MLPTNPLGAPDIAQVQHILDTDGSGSQPLGYMIEWDRTGTVPVPAAYVVVTTDGLFTIAAQGEHKGLVTRAQAYYALPMPVVGADLPSAHVSLDSYPTA